MTKLNKEEMEILQSIENGDWNRVKNLDNEKKKAKKYAEATFKKDKRINIRISEKDLASIQMKALEEGLPYQTLIASILHKYITGRLVGRK
ncbi:MAG: antitoxin [Candidatus Cloacimonetes bacterium]|nr:antitoxin [Candidatus Cloacimonadota bacterium]